SPSDRDHFAAGLIIVSEIVLLRFAINHVNDKPPQIGISRPGPKRGKNIELERATQAWTKFTVAGQPQFVAVLAEVKISHRADEPEALLPAGELIIGGRPVCLERWLRNQRAIM